MRRTPVCLSVTHHATDGRARAYNAAKAARALFGPYDLLSLWCRSKWDAGVAPSGLPPEWSAWHDARCTADPARSQDGWGRPDLEADRADRDLQQILHPNACRGAGAHRTLRLPQLHRHCAHPCPHLRRGWAHPRPHPRRLTSRPHDGRPVLHGVARCCTGDDTRLGVLAHTQRWPLVLAVTE